MNKTKSQLMVNVIDSSPKHDDKWKKQGKKKYTVWLYLNKVQNKQRCHI